MQGIISQMLSAYNVSTVEDARNALKEVMQCVVLAGLSVGTYWYDNKKEKRNGEFDVALETLTGYEMYEVKYYENPLPSEVTRKEIDKATSIERISLSSFGIISASGFEDDTNPIRKITGEELCK